MYMHFQLFQFDVNNNTGVSFTYSEPLAGNAEENETQLIYNEVLSIFLS